MCGARQISPAPPVVAPACGPQGDRGSREWDKASWLVSHSLPVPVPPPGYREGFLWKRGRDNGQFLSRKFVLTEREGALKYFNKNDVSGGAGARVGDRPRPVSSPSSPGVCWAGRGSWVAGVSGQPSHPGATAHEGIREDTRWVHPPVHP
jgi:hypothetical protein